VNRSRVLAAATLLASLAAPARGDERAASALAAVNALMTGGRYVEADRSGTARSSASPSPGLSTDACSTRNRAPTVLNLRI